MAIESSSSPLILFIDTSLNTHLSLTIDGEQNIGQLKGRLIREHADCFPQTGKISIQAVKVKFREIYYHLPDSMILACIFEHTRGVKFLQIDITPSTIKILKDSVQLDTSTKDFVQIDTSTKDFVQFDTSMEDSSDLNSQGNKKPLIKEPSYHNNIQPHEAYVQFDAKVDKKVQFDTSMKDSGDLKRKRKRKKTTSGNVKNPLVDDSVEKTNGSTSENPPRQIFPKETVSSINAIGNSSNKSLAKTTVNEKLKRVKKYSKVPPPQTTLVNCELGDTAAEISQVKKLSLEKIAAGHGDSSLRKVDDPSQKNQTKMDTVTDTKNKMPERNEDMNRTSVHEASVQVDSNTSMKDPKDLRHRRKKKKKVSSNEELPRDPLVDGSLQKINVAALEIPPKEICSKETISSTSHIKTSVKAPSDLKRKRKKQKIASMNEGLLHNPLVDDSLQKINVAASENLPEEICAEETVSKTDHINTAVKDPSDLKRKRKKEKKVSKEELLHNPPADDSLQKIDGTASEIPPREILSEERVSNNNEIVASSNKLSHPDNLQPVESLAQATVNEIAASSNKLSHPDNLEPVESLAQATVNEIVASSNKLSHPDNLQPVESLAQATVNEIAAFSNQLSHPDNLQPVESLAQATVNEIAASSNKLSHPDNLQPVESLAQATVNEVAAFSNQLSHPDYLQPVESPAQATVNEIAASSNKLSHPDNLEPAESLAQATVNDKQERCEKFSEVPPQTWLVNSSLGNVAAAVSLVKEYKQEKTGNENVYSGIDSETLAEHGDRKVDDDASHKNQTEMGVVCTTEKKPLEMEEDVNPNSVQEASVKYDFKNDSGMAASIKESSQPGSAQNVEPLLLQTAVDDEHKREEKVSEVLPQPTELLKNTSVELDSSMHGTVKILMLEHTENKPEENDSAIQTPDDKIDEAPGKGEDGGAVCLDSSIKENARTERKFRPRRVVKKISIQRYRILYNRSPPASLMLGTGSNASGSSSRHASENADFGTPDEDEE